MQKIYNLIIVFLSLIANQLAAQQTNGLFLNDSLAYNGYTLITPINYQKTYLIDNCGEVVNTWSSDYNPGLSAYLLEDGSLLRSIRTNNMFFTGGGSGGGIEKRDWDDNVTWQFIYSEDAVHHQHHDIEILPNGNILLIAWDYKTAAEALEAGRNPLFLGPSFWPDKIIEVKPIGTSDVEVVWEWHAFDHLVQDFDETKDNYGVVADHPELIDLNFYEAASPDWLHTNGVDYNPELDQIILSVRNYSEFWVIDHSTTTEEAAGHTGGRYGKGGDLLYRWGNPQAYDRGTAANRVFYAQHDAHWIPEGLPDAGKIITFNNGKGLTFNIHSSVDVIVPPVDADGHYSLATDAPYAPETLDWTYQASPAVDFYSPNLSGAQRLPNGNTLICEGSKGNVFEVNAAGEMLWRYVSPVSFGGPLSQGTTMNGQNAVFRAYRYPTDYAAFEGRNLVPMGEIELNPLDNDCRLYETIVGVSLPENGANIAFYPNPASTFLRVQRTANDEIMSRIYDLNGRLLLEENITTENHAISIEHLPEGMYVVHFYTTSGSLVKSGKLVVVR